MPTLSIYNGEELAILIKDNTVTISNNSKSLPTPPGNNNSLYFSLSYPTSNYKGRIDAGYIYIAYHIPHFSAKLIINKLIAYYLYILETNF